MDVPNDEAQQYLLAARSERSSERAQALLMRALEAVRAVPAGQSEPDHTILEADILREIALEARNPAERYRAWSDALGVVSTALRTNEHPRLVAEEALLVVDYCQDDYSDAPQRSREVALRESRGRCARAISKLQASPLRATLFARKSSVLRHLARNEPTEKHRTRVLHEALRCASRAVAENPADGANVIEFGMAEWSVARHEATDEQYAERLRKAEAHLLEASKIAPLEAAHFALSRFYRMTYRPLQACKVFPLALTQARHPRRLLREVPIYAEAAIQLWYAKYPDGLTQHHLVQSLGLLEESVSSGFVTARAIVALAFLRAALEGPDAGTTALDELKGLSRDSRTWTDVLGIVRRALSEPGQQLDLPSMGLALGLDNSAVWTRLGTFAFDILDDLALAKDLYETAVRIGPRDALALTNLARFLLRKGDADSRHKIDRLLQKAAHFADRRFRWCRAVRAEFEASHPAGPSPSSAQRRPVQQKTKGEHPPRNISELRRAFRELEAEADRQRRGYELESLLYDLVRLTVGFAKPSYRIPRGDNLSSQVDLYFEHGGEKYRVECKWRDQPADKSQILTFCGDKLDAAGVSGLFVSMAGFDDHALLRARDLAKERAILLMDGEEVRLVFDGQLNFDEVITKKRAAFDHSSEVYYRICVERSLPVAG